MRAALLLMLLPLLAACPPQRGGGDDDDDTACDPAGDPGTVRGCVYWSEDDPTPMDGGMLRVRSDPEAEPVEALLDAAGCADIVLFPDTWEFSASNAFGDCVTAWEAFGVEACETLELDFYVMLWCMDGR